METGASINRCCDSGRGASRSRDCHGSLSDPRSLRFLIMNANDFRRIALLLDGAEEGSHMGSPDFRVGGRIFATLASQDRGYGNLMLSPEQQTTIVEEQPNVFVSIAGGWGRMGATHIRLAAANED